MYFCGNGQWKVRVETIVVFYGIVFLLYCIGGLQADDGLDSLSRLYVELQCHSHFSFHSFLLSGLLSFHACCCCCYTLFPFIDLLWLELRKQINWIESSVSWELLPSLIIQALWNFQNTLPIIIHHIQHLVEVWSV